MSYQQTLFKIVKDVVNPKILKKNNRLKKWEYGYNIDYDLNEAKIKANNTGKNNLTRKNLLK